MSTINEKTTFGRKKGIRDIPENLRKGYRMAPGQLRFCIAAAVVLVLAVFIAMFIAGNRASSNIIINEEALVLQDALQAERIEAEGQKSIHFADSPVYSGSGKRLILTEKIVTSRNYWVTMSPDSEIAEYESTIGEGRFIPLEKIGNYSIWIVMATDDEMKQCIEKVEGSGLVQLNAIENDAWLNRSTDEENKTSVRDQGRNLTSINLEAFKYAQKNLLGLMYERPIVPHEAPQENIRIIEEIIECLKKGDVVTAVDEYAWTLNNVLTWYTMNFSEEVIKIQDDMFWGESNKDNLYWGTNIGFIKAEVDDVVRTLIARYDEENGDFKEEIAAFEKMLSKFAERVRR